MTQDHLERIGPFAFLDSGTPSQGKSSTTLFLIHGYAWHGAVFARLLPLAAKQGCRLVLINRRDYLGSAPLTANERETLDIATRPHVTTEEALSSMLVYTKARAIELHDFLCTFIEDNSLPEKSVILAAWSFGSAWVTQLLAHTPDLPTHGPPLYRFLKRVVWYDPPYHALGYPPPDPFYNPLTDPSHAPGEGIKLFSSWVSGYYAHGDSPSQLEHRTPLSYPPPTLLTMTDAERDGAIYPAPGSPGGSDEVLLHAGVQCGLFKVLRERALYVSGSEGVEGWDSLELRYVWCDQSVWELPWATWALQAEVQEAEKTGRKMRSITLLRMRNANHFPHWDQPERALNALLTDSPGEA